MGRKKKLESIRRHIVFVAGLHGDEQIPVRALAASRTPFILGNPRAQKKNVRFTARDLNAAFGVRGEHYEAKRAREILKAIDKRALVVDFHTTSAETPPFAIVVDPAMIPFAATSGLRHVVLMTHNIKRGNALINRRDGFSVEAGNHGTKASYRTTIQVVRNVLSGKPGKRHPVKVYEVYGKITKKGAYRNFMKHRDGFVPVLSGEKAYDFYGLKARRIL